MMLGHVVMLVPQLEGDTVLTAVAPEIMPQPGATPDPAYFAYRLGTGFFFIALGGVDQCVADGRAEMKHALGLAVLLSSRASLRCNIMRRHSPFGTRSH